jgi:hypothetical protein
VHDAVKRGAARPVFLVVWLILVIFVIFVSSWFRQRAAGNCWTDGARSVTLSA